MGSNRGVTCYACGASAQLPEDLNTPTFACTYCHATLETVRYAGSMAVSADALAAHLRKAAAEPVVDIHAHVAAAPKMEHGSAGARRLPCKLCGAPLDVPLDVTVHRVTCGGCGREQAITDYVSDRERFEIDMARQVAGNQALKRLEAEGVPCTKCGGRSPLRERGVVQIPCVHCGATILLSDHVDASAIARHRLAAQVFELRDDLMAEQLKKNRRRDLAIGAFVLGCIAVLALIGVLTGAR